MKQIQLTQGKVALVDDEDFEWLNQWKWTPVDNKKTSYARRAFSVFEGRQTFKTISMHRAIMKVSDPKIFIDHKDHNGLNNQRSNLRICSHSENNANKLPQQNRHSKYMGVGIVNKNKPNSNWKATICKNGIDHHLGVFKTEEEAALAYNEASKRIHGEFGYINKIEQTA